MKIKPAHKYMILTAVIIAALVFKPLLHIAALAFIGYRLIRFAFRLIRFLAPVLLFIAALYILIN